MNLPPVSSVQYNKAVNALFSITGKQKTNAPSEGKNAASASAGPNGSSNQSPPRKMPPLKSITLAPSKPHAAAAAKAKLPPPIPSASRPVPKLLAIAYHPPPNDNANSIAAAAKVVPTPSVAEDAKDKKSIDSSPESSNANGSLSYSSKNSSSSSESVQNSSDSDSDVEAQRRLHKGKNSMAIVASTGTKPKIPTGSAHTNNNNSGNQRIAPSRQTNPPKPAPELSIVPVRNQTRQSISVLPAPPRTEKSTSQALALVTAGHKMAGKAKAPSRLMRPSNVPAIAARARTGEESLRSKLDDLVSEVVKYNNTFSPENSRELVNYRENAAKATVESAAGITTVSSDLKRRMDIKQNMLGERLIIDPESHIRPLINLLMATDYMEKFRGSCIATVFQAHAEQEVDEANEIERQDLLFDPRKFTAIKMIIEKTMLTTTVNRASQENFAVTNMEHITRAWNAEQLREPRDTERRCVNDTACWVFCHFGFVMKEFDTPKQEEYYRTNNREQEVKMCLPCLRNHILRSFMLSMVKEQQIDVSMITQTFCNIADKEGEYVSHDCVKSSISALLPVVINHVHKYSISSINQIKYLKESGYATYSDSSGILELQSTQMSKNINSLKNFQPGALHSKTKL